MPNSSFASEGGGGIKEPSPLKGGYHKQRRKSDPPLKNRGLGKENKHPNPNKPHNSSPSLNVSNKMDNAKKVVSGKNVPLRPGIKSAVHQNRTKSLQTVIKPREAHVKQAFPMLDSNDDDVSDSAFGNRSDECEVIEIRGCEYKKGEDDTSSSNGDLSDQAESIVSKILEQPESERSIDNVNPCTCVRYKLVVSDCGMVSCVLVHSCFFELVQYCNYCSLILCDMLFYFCL